MEITIAENYPEQGNDTYKLPHAGTFVLPTKTRDALVSALFDAATSVLIETSAGASQIKADARLSDVGRAEKLAPLVGNAADLLANSWTNLENYSATIDRRESDLLSVPKVDPTHTAVAIEDREIREYWRGLSIAQRAELLHKFENQPGLERMQMALLRSPVALADAEIQSVRASWEKAVRIQNPHEAIAIDEGRAAVEWGRRALVTVGAIAKRSLELKADDVLDRLVASPNPALSAGVGVFGFDASPVEQAKRRIMQRKVA